LAEEATDEMHSDAVEGGNYDVIRQRLSGMGSKLRDAAQALNERRSDTFGSTELVIAGNERIRTENNCVPRDIVQVGGHLLVGYTVFLGLKKKTTVEDVFSLQSFERTDEGFHNVTDEAALGWLNDRSFVREFEELFQYYADARLIQLRVTETKLLAVFQTGATARDVKVLRWAVDPGGRVTYIDNRGERDHVFPATHDFEWQATSRADHILGRHPHVNILDTVFVETVGGDLTVKVEDNTEDGEGIYSEPVDDPNQSLDDAEIHYAKRGVLLLIRIKPFRETVTRYLVFNTNTRTVSRIDAIGQSCVSLPEDHGILFPGGYVLRTGEVKVFDEVAATPQGGMEFVKRIDSPNGEDVLYLFHRRHDGQYALYPYNLIRKEISTPITAHGWSHFDDGTLIVLKATNEPTRVHPVQVWSTPFVSAEVHEAAPTDGSLLGRIGNRDLVRGISDALTLVNLVNNSSPTREVYEELVLACNRFVDAYYWAHEPDVGDLKAHVEGVRRTAELIIDEFEKVQTLKRRAKEVIKEAQRAHDKLLTDVRPEYFKSVEEFLAAMTELRKHRGQLITHKEVRYVDLPLLDKLEEQTVQRFDEVSKATVDFLLGDEAFTPLITSLDELLAEIEAIDKATDLSPLTERLDAITEGVNLLGEVVAGLQVDDPTEKTTILEGIAEVVAGSNRTRAVLDNRRKSLRSAEGKAEFGAQFKLYGQSVASALALCDTPEACDEQLSRMLLQLEELEARFGEFDEFLPQLADKREEVYEAFTSRKQTLLDERNKRVASITGAADRVLGGIERRSRTFKSEEELASWFAADPMILKLRQFAEQLTALGDTVKSDELLARLKTARQDALRGLRDKLDLFEEGNLVRFGKHRFSVNTQPLELTLVPDGTHGLALSMNGTDFREPIDDEHFLATRPFWGQSVVSETKDTYRAEYLAYKILEAADAGTHGLSPAILDEAILQEQRLLEVVRTFAADRYDESYDRGIHDADAARILASLVALRKTAGLLRFAGPARAMATLTWSFAQNLPKKAWIARARALGKLRDALGPSPEVRRFVDTLGATVRHHHLSSHFVDDTVVEAMAQQAGAYLFEALQLDPATFTFSQPAEALTEGLLRWLDDHGGQMSFEDALAPLGDDYVERFRVKEAFLRTFAARDSDHDPELALEAATLLLCRSHVDAHVAGGDARAEVRGLLGSHPSIRDGALELRLDAFTARLEAFATQRVPGFKAYREARAELLETQRKRLRIDEFKPKVMTAFVRNKLINDVYLHLVGDNLAKQMGAAGDAKRTDLMGLLLLISPPGYGKTTLMEYIASRLGLTFVKVNGPALGHEVKSLDPSEAPNATARQEVEKANLALEMGNNVMLYLDDIQHCHPEFLQKFISLCDAQRRIEGVWRGRTRTYDMRGKKFAVVMAGNPYTESGDKFQIPDMLANRADTYNLGDILGGREEVFALSFLENSLTSNPVLQPLATRSQDDVYKLVRKAQGEPVAASDLSHDYSAVEMSEIDAVLKHLFRCQDVLLKVNAEYIRSAAMEDSYRVEPRFQLQGSYRNMNKLAEKVVPAMNDDEVVQLVTDHYTGEAQTLTTGAEFNLLRLAELRDMLTDAQAARLKAIRDEFARQQLMGGDDDPATKVSGVLAGLVKEVSGLREGMASSPLSGELASLRASVEQSLGTAPQALTEEVRGLKETLAQGAGTSSSLAEVSQSVSGIAKALQEDRTGPLVEALAALQQDRTGPLVEAIAAMQAPFAAALKEPPIVDLSPLLHELRALREQLEAQGSRPVHVAASAVDPDAVTPPAAPRREETQRVLFARAQAALSESPTPPMPEGGSETLIAALGVIEQLTVHMAAAAQSRLPSEQHAVFLEELRRTVAKAVNDLAG